VTIKSENNAAVLRRGSVMSANWSSGWLTCNRNTGIIIKNKPTTCMLSSHPWELSGSGGIWHYTIPVVQKSTPVITVQRFLPNWSDKIPLCNIALTVFQVWWRLPWAPCKRQFPSVHVSLGRQCQIHLQPTPLSYWDGDMELCSHRMATESVTTI